MVTPSVNSRMRPSIARFNETGRSAGGAIPEINRLAQNAMIRPNPPPIADTSRLSVRSCRMSRNRLAPMDRRIAISLRRADALATSSPATLVQAAKSTIVTTPIRIARKAVIIVRKPGSMTLPGVMAMDRFRFDSG